MPQDINTKVNPIGGETGKPGGASGAPSKSDLTSITKWIDSLKENLYISDKFEKVRDKIRKHFVDETKLTDKYVKGIIKENTNIKVQTKLLKENLETSKKVLQLNAKKAKKQLFGQNFDTLVSARSVIKQIGHSINKDIEGELEEVDKLLGKNRLGWIAVGAATIYASKKTYEYVESVADAAVNFATYRKNLQSVASSTLIAPKGVDQLEEIRETLGQTTKQFSEFVDIARSSAFPNAAEDLSKVSESLKNQFGEDQNQRLKQYVDLLNEIPSIDTDLSITATLDDKAEAVVNLIEAGKLDIALDLQSAGLLGGQAAPQTDQQKRDSALLNATEEMEAGVENIKQSILQYLPADAIKFATIVGQVTLLAGTAYGALTTLGTIATLLKQPPDTKAQNLAVAGLSTVHTDLQQVKAAIQGAKTASFLQKGGGAGESVADVAVKGGGGKAALISLAVVAATTAITSLIAKATGPSSAGSGGIEAGNLAVEPSAIKEVGSEIAGAVVDSAKEVAIGAAAQSIATKGLSATVKGGVAAAKGGLATAAEGAGAAKGFLAGGTGLAKFAKGGIFAALTIAAEYAGDKLLDFGKKTVNSAKDARDAFDVDTSSAERVAASNDILKGSAASAGGALLKFGASIAGGAGLGSLLGGPIGALVGGLAGAAIGAKDFASDFGTAIKDFNDELDPGYFKTALNLAVLAPLGPVGLAMSAFGVNLSTIGGAMHDAAEKADDLTSYLASAIAGSKEGYEYDVKQKKIQKEHLALEKKQIVEDKKYLAAVRANYDLFVKSAKSLELFKKQLQNATHEQSVASQRLKQELANLAVDIGSTVGGSLTDFSKALDDATGAAVAVFNKFSKNLDAAADRIQRDGNLSAQDRAKALIYLHIQEAKTLKGFSAEVQRIAEEFAKIPSIVLNDIRTELAEKQKEVSFARGGKDDATKALGLSAESISRKFENLGAVLDAMPAAFEGVEKGIKSIEDKTKETNKQGFEFLEKNAEKVKSIGGPSGGTKKDYEDFGKKLSEEIESAADKLKSSGVVKKGFSKALEDSINQASSEAKPLQGEITEKQGQIAATKIEAEKNIKYAKEEKDKAAIKAKLDKETAEKEAEINTISSQLYAQGLEQLKLEDERVKNYAESLKKSENLTDKEAAALNIIEKGEKSKDTVSVVALRKKAALLASQDAAAVTKEVGFKAQALQAVNNALKTQDTTTLREGARAQIAKKAADIEVSALKSNQEILDTTESNVETSKERLKAEAEQARALTDIEKFGAGGKAETSAESVGAALSAIQKESATTIGIYEEGLKKIQAIAAQQEQLAAAKQAEADKAASAGNGDEAARLSLQASDLRASVDKASIISDNFKLKIDEKITQASERSLAAIEKSADLQKRIIESNLSLAENISSTLSEIGATPGAILQAQKKVIGLEKERLDIIGREVSQAQHAVDIETNSDIKDQKKVALQIKLNEFENARLELVKKTVGVQRDGYEKLVALQLGQLRSKVGARSGIGSNAAIFGRDRVQLQSGLQVKGGSTTIAQRQAQIAGAASGLSNGQPVSQFGNTLGNNPSRSPTVKALQFNKSSITPAAQTPASGTVPASQVPATGASTVPTPGGPAATKGEANKVGVNIKTNVEVTFDTDMFKSKVRQFVLKDPDIQGGLAKIFVQVR